MILQIIAATLTAIGDVLIGISILKVHESLSREKKVDARVIARIKEEHLYVYAGIFFIFAGLVLQVFNISL